MAVQLDQTDALLNKYIDILSRSEEFTRLIQDEQWMGADAVRERRYQRLCMPFLIAVVLALS